MDVTPLGPATPLAGARKPAPAAASTGAASSTDSLRLNAVARAERPLSPEDRQLLDEIETAHLRYFTAQSHPATGLTRDRSTAGSPASIAAVGFSLTAHGVAVHRGLMTRAEAADYTLKTLKTLEAAEGKNGFLYHFLDPGKATRAMKSEVSTVDTALMLGGVLFSRNFFDGDDPAEAEIRRRATALYDRVDWNWARNGRDTLSMGWKPEEKKVTFLDRVWDFLKHPFRKPAKLEAGFLPHRWQGYSEGMLMVLLGMGSKTHPLPANAWDAYMAGSGTKRVNGQPYVPFGPMFGHQYSHTWIDFRGIQDQPSRERGWDWAENSRRATLAQQAYAIENPKGFKGYGELDWGLTASDGPGKQTQDGRKYNGYLARGAPGDHDDGTIAPTAAAGSIAFAPEIVIPTLRHWRETRPEIWTPEGFADAFNPTFDPSKPSGWVGKDRIGIDQGPIALMTENFRSEFVWNVMKKDPDLRRGLERAGFTGGWLGG